MSTFLRIVSFWVTSFLLGATFSVTAAPSMPAFGADAVLPPEVQAKSTQVDTPLDFLSRGGSYVFSSSSPIGTEVGEVAVSDSNPASRPTFEFQSGLGINNDGFAIDPSSGIIRSTQNFSAVSVGQTRTLQVKVTDDGLTSSAYFQVLLLAPTDYATRGVTFRRYSNPNSMTIKDFTQLSKYPNSPDSHSVRPQPLQYGTFSSLYDWQNPHCPDNNGCGQRWTGYLRAPETGRYRFYLTSGQQGEFRISSSASPLDLPSGPQAYRYFDDPMYQKTTTWDFYYSNRATTNSVHLVKGQIYYFEGLANGFLNSNHFAIAWKTPTGTTPASIKLAQTTPVTVLPTQNLFPETTTAGANSKSAVSALVSRPAPVKNLVAESVTNGEVKLAWGGSNSINPVTDYLVYRNGSLFQTIQANEGDRYFSAILSEQFGIVDYAVRAKDALGSLSDTVAVKINADKNYDSIHEALSSGNSDYLSNPDVILDRIIKEIDDSPIEAKTLYDSLYRGVQSVNYKPSNLDILMRPGASGLGRVLPLIHPSDCNGGPCTPGIEMGVFGLTPKSNRFAAFPARAFDEGSASGYQSALKNTFSWVATGDGSALPSVRKIAIFQESDGYLINSTFIANALKRWGWVNSESVEICTPATWKTCLQGNELLVVGSQGVSDSSARAFAGLIKSADQANIPIIYSENKVSPQSEATKSAAAYLGFDSYYIQLASKAQAVYLNAEAIESMKNASAANVYSSLRTLIQHLRQKDWNVNLSVCSAFSCPAGSLARSYLDSEFYAGSRKVLQPTLTGLDVAGIKLFDSKPSCQAVLKLAVLLGDLYRRSIKYPISGNTNNLVPFFEAQFADHVSYNNRNHNAAQLDLGDFSQAISPTVERFEDLVDLRSRSGDYFTSLGGYAIPGQSVEITRTDDSPVKVQLFVNTLRSGSTKEFDNYSRPKYLSSAQGIPTPTNLYMDGGINLDPGETIVFTSAYGGPLQALLGKQSSEYKISLKLNNIGHHPVWNGKSSTEVFTKTLNEADYNWSEFLTPGYQVHSRTQYMFESMEDPRFNTPEKLAKAAVDGFYLTSYNMAGFKGPDLELSPEVRALCIEKNWDCDSTLMHGLPSMNHFNADRAMCVQGSGCSGNPYDGSWGFDPIDWADSHEMGHNLQAFSLVATDNSWATKEVSNVLFPARIVQRWNSTNPSQPVGADVGINQDALFKLLNDAQLDPLSAPAKIANALWYPDDYSADYSYGETAYKKLSFYLQLIEQANALQPHRFSNEGWDVITALYLLERQVTWRTYSFVSASQWDQVKQSLCLSDYTRDGAQAAFSNGLGYNDRFLIEVSCVTGMDQRDFFDMWGVRYSAKASNIQQYSRLNRYD